MPVDELLRKALARPGVSRHFEVDGARLHALTWNGEAVDRPGLLFLHGFVGHAHWWDFVAPSFADRWRVAALDLSGMGDSAPRATYDGLKHSRDILGAIDALGFAPATVIAHSYSGSRLLRACVESPARVTRAILVDAYVNFADTDAVPQFPGGLSRRVYPDEATALARFRLHPPQPVPWPALFEHIGRHSIRHTPDGWTWKFDPGLTADYDADGASILARMATPLDFVYGEHSKVVRPARARRIMESAAQGREAIEVPGAHHHLIIDQPIALIATLRALLCGPPA